jgi:hypothetical protein
MVMTGMRNVFRRRRGLRRLFPLGAGKSLLLACCTLIASLCLAWHVTGSSVSAQDVDYISDRAVEVSLTHRQDWGDFGLNTAAARSGATGSPMQIGEKLYAKGLGHHANGEIAIELRGQYTAFRTGQRDVSHRRRREDGVRGRPAVRQRPAETSRSASRRRAGTEADRR